MSTPTTVLADWADYFFPPCCPYCAAPAHETDTRSGAGCEQHRLVCAAVPRCERCARRLPAAGHSCLGCAAAKGIERGVTLGDYDQEALRAWILAYKHGGRVDLARVLGPLLRAALGEADPSGPVEVLVPVPLHLTRRLERGYNQALVLAQAVARAGPRRFVVRQVLRRVRATVPQGSTDPLGCTAALDRHTNVRGAFAPSRPARWSAASVRGRSVWLVDDVWTSGATLEECASMLHSMGAQRVQALVLARAAHRVP